MALIIETGVGLRIANSYIDEAFATTYLTERNRQTENSWDTVLSSVKEAAIIAAVDYIEKVWGHKFRGHRAVWYNDTLSTATIVFAGLPSDTETFTLGEATYTFVTALSGAAYEILIGGTADDMATNTGDAINATDAALDGVTYGTGTPTSHSASAEVSSATVTLTSRAPGSSGDFTVLSGTPTNTTLNAFSGGEDGGPQALSFPRVGLYTIKEGILIEGIPLKLKHACCEYAVRAAANPLLPDTEIDEYRGTLKRRRTDVGPIREEFEYNPSTVVEAITVPYLEADKLLKEYIGPGGGVSR